MTDPRRAWMTVATAAAVFAFVVLLVMLGLHARPVGENPFDSSEWLALKKDLSDRPTDPVIAERARTLDLDLRRRFFRRQERIRNGGTLLLVGLVVFLVAFKRAHRRVLPEPDVPAPAPPDEVRDRRAAHAGRGVAVTGLLLAAGALLLGITAPAEVVVPEGDPDAVRPGEVATGAPTEADLAAQWPSFRGYDGSGVTTIPDLPGTWDGTTGANVAWKTPIPLPGTNSPVVWGNRIFLTGADARREEVYCVDVETGALLWKKGLIVAGRRVEFDTPMEDTGYAAPTAATDGRSVFVMFASGRVAAFDLEGQQLWLKSFGPFENSYGHSSSLALLEDRLFLQIDEAYVDDGKSRVIALDAATGAVAWETRRKVDSSWASPIIARTPSGPQLVLSATPRVAAYDPRTGTEIWRADVIQGEVGPTPIARDGVVYVMQEDVGLYAIGTDGAGDVTESKVMWDVADGASDVTSPVCDGERVYMLTSGGTLTCVRAATGDVIYEQELEAAYYSSPTISGRVLYVTSMKGVTTTVKLGDAFEEIGKSPLGEGVVASFAFGPGRIYVRGKDHLFAIGGPE